MVAVSSGISLFTSPFKVIPQSSKIVAACLGMHVSPAKHSYACLPRKCYYWTDRRTGRQTLDNVIPMCRYASHATQKQF